MDTASVEFHHCNSDIFRRRSNDRVRRWKLHNSKQSLDVGNANTLRRDLIQNGTRIPLNLLESSTASSFEEMIITNYQSRIDAQLRFDRTGEVQKKIGRPSSCKTLQTYQLSCWFEDLVHEKMVNLLVKMNLNTRSDLLSIEIFRAIRKLPNYFVKNFSTQVIFKNSDISKSIIGIIRFVNFKATWQQCLRALKMQIT